MVTVDEETAKMENEVRNTSYIVTGTLSRAGLSSSPSARPFNTLSRNQADNQKTEVKTPKALLSSIEK